MGDSKLSDNIKDSMKQTTPNVAARPPYGRQSNENASTVLTRRGDWDTDASYRENLGLFESKHLHGLQSIPAARPSWDADRFPIRNAAGERHRIHPGAIDISSSRSQQQLNMIPCLPTERPVVHPSTPPLLHSATNATRHFSPSPLLPVAATVGGHTAPVVGARSDANRDRSYNHTGSEASALMEAIKNKNFVEVKHLVEKGVNLNSKEIGCPPLHMAAKMGDVKTLEYLVRCGADVGASDDNGRTVEYYLKKLGLSLHKLKGTKTTLAPAPSEWKKSYSGEATVPATSYVPDMQRPLQHWHQAHQGRYPSPQTENFFAEGNHSTTNYISPANRAKVKDDAYGKLLPDRHSQSTKQNSYPYEYFPSPYEHMRRPAQTDYNSPINNLKHQNGLRFNSEPTFNTRPGSKPAVNGSKLNSRVSEHGNPANSTRIEVMNNYENCLQPPQKYVSPQVEPQKPSSFSIDDITKSGPTTSAHRLPSSESGTKPLYGMQHTPKRADTNTLPLTGINSPFPNDFYRFPTIPHSAAVPGVYTNVPSPLKMPPATTFPYVYQPPHEISLPISGMVYNPLHPALGGYISKDHGFNRQHEQQLLQMPNCDLNSLMQPLTDVNKHRKNATHIIASDHRVLGYENQEAQTMMDNGWSCTDSPHDHRHKVKVGKSHIQETYTPTVASTPRSSAHRPNNPLIHNRPRSTYNQGIVSQALMDKPPHELSRSDRHPHMDHRNYSGHLAQQAKNDNELLPHNAVAETLPIMPITSENSNYRFIAGKDSLLQHTKEKPETLGVTGSMSKPVTNSESAALQGSNSTAKFSEKRKCERKVAHPSLKKAESSGTSSVLSADNIVQETLPAAPGGKLVAKSAPAEISASQKGNKRRKRTLADSKADSNDLSRTLSSDNENSRRGKRPRKSETEDEYLYDWVYEGFSSSDTENDDSSDEDFHCTSNIVQSKSNRQSSLRSSGQLNQAGSMVDVPSESDVSGSQTSTRSRKSTRKRADKVEKQLPKGIKRKQKKARKLSSESSSSLTHREQISDSENKSGGKRKPTKLNKVAISEQAEDKKVRRKYKTAQKGTSKKFNLPAGRKTNKRGAHLRLKNLTKLSVAKRIKVDDKAGHDQSSKDLKKKKKIKKIKAIKNEPLDQTQSVLILPRPVTSMDLKVPTSKTNAVVTDTSSGMPLIELYTGKSKSSTSSIGSVEDHGKLKMLGGDITEAPKEDQLFGNELTESEAKALRDTCIKKDDTTTTNENLNSTNSLVAAIPAKETGKTSGQKIPNSLSTPGIKTPEKTKKKMGRKPKLQNSIATSSSMCHQLQKSGTISKLRESLKASKPFKVKSKNLPPNKGKPSGRKGRPPGSLNKNKPKIKKEKRIERAPSKLKKSIAKVEQEEAMQISPGNVVEHPTQATSIMTHHQKKRPQTPVQRNVLNDGVQEPSSLSNTPFRSLQSRCNSGASTPLSFSKDRRTPNFLPLPPNMKKLTHNLAIGETVLHKAARHGYMDNIEFYLGYGFDVNVKDNAGYTALHEACVHGKLEAVKLLLQFGADVNLNSEDGTRPIHDAVEYDRVEVTRLLLACGADPNLSKFSGRSIKNMIRSKEMESFMLGYLKELDPVVEENKDDPDRLWKLHASSVLDQKNELGCNPLDYPPSDDNHCDYMDFQMYEEPPPSTYLVQPSSSSRRANYYLLSNILRSKGCSRADFLLENPADIKTMPTDEFRHEVASNWVPKMFGGKMEISGDFVELITAKKLIGEATVLRVSSNGDIVSLEGHCPSKKNRSYPHGSFAEKWQKPVADHCRATENSCMEVSLDPADVPCYSRSSFRSETCSSPTLSDAQNLPLVAQKLSALTSSLSAEVANQDLKYTEDSTPQRTCADTNYTFKNTSGNIHNLSSHTPVINGYLQSNIEHNHQGNISENSINETYCDLPLQSTTNQSITDIEQRTNRTLVSPSPANVLLNNIDSKPAYDITSNGISKDSSLTKLCNEFAKTHSTDSSIPENPSDSIQQPYNCVTEIPERNNAFV